MTDETTPETTTPRTESHDPAVPEAYAAFMRTGWGDRERDFPPHPITGPAAERRARLAATFPGERLVLPAGSYRTRANDTDYRFRADTAHAYFSGNLTSDAVLVLDDGEPVLFARPRSGRDTDEFFRDRRYGELWAGRRPSLSELSASLGIEVRHVDELEGVLSSSGKTRVHRGVSAKIDGLVAADDSLDDDFARVISEMRLVKDDWEVGELQAACDATTLGFEDSVKEWDGVLEHGERWLEGTFFRRARTMGNDIGYDSIVAGGRHATTLHWIENSGSITPGELVLLDMGVARGGASSRGGLHLGRRRAVERLGEVHGGGGAPELGSRCDGERIASTGADEARCHRPRRHEGALVEVDLGPLRGGHRRGGAGDLALHLLHHGAALGAAAGEQAHVELVGERRRDARVGGDVDRDVLELAERGRVRRVGDHEARVQPKERLRAARRGHGHLARRRRHLRPAASAHHRSAGAHGEEQLGHAGIERDDAGGHLGHRHGLAGGVVHGHRREGDGPGGLRLETAAAGDEQEGRRHKCAGDRDGAGHSFDSSWEGRWRRREPGAGGELRHQRSTVSQTRGFTR